MATYITGGISKQLTDASPQAAQPDWIIPQLRPHQLSLLCAARRLESKAAVPALLREAAGGTALITSYGILADRVGAGKSLVALSLARDAPVQKSHLKIKERGGAHSIGIQHMPPCDDWNPDWLDASGISLGPLLTPRRHPLWYSRTALILVPHSTITQWEDYVTNQTTLRAAIIKRTKDCDYSATGWLHGVLTADVVIVSCTMMKKFIGAVGVNGPAFKHIVWSRFFIDEADTILTTLRMEDVKARFFWFLTGSWLNMMFPDGLYRHTIALFSEQIKQILGSGVIAGLHNRANIVARTIGNGYSEEFCGLILRNRDDWIDKSLLRPTIVHDTILCSAPATLGVLQNFITPAAMEALHAGDTAGALTALGLKPADKETIAERVTASLRGELIQAEKILAFKRDIEYATAAGKLEAIKKAEEKVGRIRDQLADLEGRLTGLSGDGAPCPICYDIPHTPTLTPCCRQTFCLSCICECIVKKPVCPLCRKPIATPTDLQVVSDIAGVADEPVSESMPTKGAALLKLLSASTEDQRFLVFSAHEASFRGLRELLSARGVRCEVLQGTVARIERLRKQFRTGEVRVLCMNARHVGAGINLEAATHVVLFHRMNVELEKQVIGRAVRFERAAELRVVHLVHDGETAANGAQSSNVIVHI